MVFLNSGMLRAIERMSKISAMWRVEDASQPMMVQSTPIENNLCEAILSNYKIHLYARLCEPNGYMHIHLELDIMHYNYIYSLTIL